MTSMACGAAQSTGMSVGWLVAGSMPRHVPADHTFDWSTSATLPWNASCWLFGPGQLQAAQHPALTGLAPRLVARPQQADAELAVGVVLGAEVLARRGLALLLADLLDAGGATAARRRGRTRCRGTSACRWTRRPRSGARPCSRRSAPRRGCAPASSGSRRSWRGRRCRCRGRRGRRAGDQADRVLAVLAAGERGDEAGDEQAAQGGQQQRAARGGGLQALPPGVRPDGERPRRRAGPARSGASNIGSIVTGASSAVTSDAVVMLCGCAPAVLADLGTGGGAPKVGFAP